MSYAASRCRSDSAVSHAAFWQELRTGSHMAHMFPLPTDICPLTSNQPAHTEGCQASPFRVHAAAVCVSVPATRVHSPCVQLHVKLQVVCTQCVECCQQVLHVLVLTSCLVSQAAPQGGPAQSLGGPSL